MPTIRRSVLNTPAAVSGALVVILSTTPVGGLAQSLSPRDSAALVETARDRQRDFERFRQSRIPVDRDPAGPGRCDEQIGRICIWFGGEAEEDFPPEPPETTQARRGLIGVFLEAAEQVADPWLLGQLVHYLVEDQNPQMAEQVARDCGLAASWWCSALEGYALHARGEFVEAEAAFREAQDAMPPEERERWLTRRHIFLRTTQEAFDRADPAERQRRWELFWRLSDPLYLVEGNDRFTDHFARWVEVRNLENADNPQGMHWEEDLEETLVRYGMHRGWSKRASPPAGMDLRGRMQLQDTRRMVGHHHPRSRGYLFPEAFLSSPSDVPPESWITAPREARTWYAPPYAPDFQALESQIGRFRRGEEMLVVGAYRPEPPRSAAESVDPFTPRGERMFQPRGPVESGLFLVPEDGGEATEVRSADVEGVFTLRTLPGRYVSSLEVLEPGLKRAWRARQGVSQSPLAPGLVAVSDLLVLARGAPFPATLEEAIPHVRRGIRVARGERFTVVWEVYGLQVREPVAVTLGFTRGRPGFLQRVGEFVGVVEPDRPVEISFEDAGGDAGDGRVQSVFRAVVLELPELEPGEYTLHLRLDLPGREPAIASRPLLVEG